MVATTASLLAWQLVQGAWAAMVPSQGADAKAAAKPIAAAAAATTPGADLTLRFVLPPPAPGEPELTVTLWAISPQLANPTNLDVDCDGRVWVTEALRYRGIPDHDPKALRHEKGDRVVILADRDGDGVCDESKVFVEDPDLLAPLGIAVFGPPGGPREVYVSCSPNVFRYVDADGDDVPERRDTFLTGFGGRDHDHGVHALVQGPDGALWFNAGNQGPHVVTDADGRTLRAGSFIDGGIGVAGDDGHAWLGGVAMRVGRDGRGLTAHAHNFRNCYEIAVDAFGDVWQNDNDDDGNQGCRIAWVMRGANQGYVSADGKRSWQADRRPGQSTATAHWHQDDPGVAPSGAITGAGGPTGIVLHEGSALGSAWDGALLSCDAGRSLVWGCVPQPQGAGFTLAPTVFLQPRTDDPERSLFRPSDAAVDLDGALFVADWWDPMVGGHGMLDRAGGGRILRVQRRGAKGASAARPDFETIEGVLAALDSPAVHVRAAAFDALGSPGLGNPLHLDVVADKIARLGPTPAAARQIWLLAQERGEGQELVQSFQDPKFAAPLVVTALRAVPPDWGTERGRGVARRLAASASPAIRREIALAMRGAPLLHLREIAVALARALDPADRFEVEAFGLLCEGFEDALWPDLVAALGDTPTKWSARFEAIAWRLHPAAALDAFVARARSTELPFETRRRAVDALAFVPSPRVADALFELLRHGPDDIRPHAAAWLQQRGGLSLERGAAAWSSGVIRHDDAKRVAGEIEVAVDLTGAELLWLVVGDAGDGNGHDWADWIEPTLHGPARADGTHETVRLTTLAPLVANVGWGSLGVDQSCGGGPLRSEFGPIAFGFGAHASSELAFLLPPGRFERFTARAAPDLGGSEQSGARTSLEFSVHVTKSLGGAATGDSPERTADIARLASLRDRLLERTTPRDEQLKLVRKLAADPAAGLLLIELAGRGALDEELREAAAPALFRHPDLAVRALASESFPLRAADGSALPSVEKLLALNGDAGRGRELFASDRTGCSKCHSHGDHSSGDVGPALTQIGAKYDRAALLDALLHPSAAIAFGYEPWIVVLKSGDIASGFVLADGDPLILKEPSGARRTIAAADVLSKRRSKLSLMPDNVASGLTPQELADLVEFLARSGR